MANLDIDNRLGVVDKRKGLGTTTSPIVMANYQDVAAMRARLTAINSTSYSVIRLDQMTKNDMEYAIRLNDDSAGM